MSNSDNDRKIVEQIIGRNEKVLTEFFQAHKQMLFSFIHRQISDKHVVEELVQDTFMDFIEALRDFHFQCTLKTFLFSIARNKVIDTIRKKKVKKILFSSLPTQYVEEISAVFIDQEIEKRELVEKINHVISKLPHDYQIVLRLKYIDGEKVQDIAEVLKIPFKATESLLFRARKAFTKNFETSP